ncbi:hypothetical protein KP79_PYT16642 [Mizuhopecten yessoensis]|uniref:Otopetrin-2 n=1 Tax=Mizuhopecten yessoensis TaxID=6573 RepID=A0A210R348_MIZYE|nr:hypothetical protein KP79_PYT16642 [Mizuhopecten yessoensis]
MITSVFILPFTAGNYRRRQNGFWYYDCSISFRVLFLGFLAIIVVFSATNTIYDGANVRLGVVLLLLSVLILGGVSVCLILVCLAQLRGLQCIVATRRHTHTTKLQVCFLWIFGLASILFSTLLVGKLIECSGNGTAGLYWNSIICFNCLLVVCFISEIIFITYFSEFKLKHSTLANYSMLLLLASNTCVQLYVSIIGDHPLATFIEINKENATNWCLERNSTMTALIEKSRSILTPTFMEFFLLSSTMILDIWSPSNENSHENETRHSEINGIQDSERTSLLPHTSAIEPDYSGNGSRRMLCQMITIVVSLMTGFGMVIFYVAMAMNVGNIQTLHFLAEFYELILKVLMTIATFLGFFCLVTYCTPDRSPKRFKSRENVYLLSVFGLMMLHICKVIQGDVTSYLDSKILLYTNIISIFQDYLQVVLLLHANQCKKSDPRSRIVLLESVLLFIMINNFVLWINDTFLLSQYPITRVMAQERFSTGLLRLGYTVLLPVSVFYRFTSFLQYYATFRDYTF